jgi:hypothetical protein
MPTKSLPTEQPFSIDISRKFAETLRERLQARRQLVDRAREYFSIGSTSRALALVITAIEQINDHDENLLMLHKECLALMSISERVLEHEAKSLNGAMIVPIDVEDPEEEHEFNG